MNQITSYGQLEQHMKRFLAGAEKQTFWQSGPLDDETKPHVQDLLAIQNKMITIDSQPGEMGNLSKSRAYICGFIKSKRLKKFLPKILETNKTALILLSHIKKRNFKMQCRTRKYVPVGHKDQNFITKIYYHKEIEPVPNDIPVVVLEKDHPVYGKNAQAGGADAHFNIEENWPAEFSMIPNIPLRNWMIKKTIFITIIDMEFGKNTLFKDVLSCFPKMKAVSRNAYNTILP